MPKLFKTKIEKIVQEGYGLGRVNGKVVFIPYVLPDEEVVGEIEEDKKDVSFAKLVKVVGNSEYRIKPLCPYFGECGGCHFQMAKYEYQLKLKEDIVRDAFEHVGKIRNIPLEPIVPSPKAYYYRTRAHFPLKRVKGKLYIGFYRAGSHFLISIDKCPIQKKIIIDWMLKIRDILQEERISVYDEKKRYGRLRYLSIRTNDEEKETIVVFVTKDKGFPKRIVKRIEEMGELKGIIENINPGKGNVIFGKEVRFLSGRDYIFEKVRDIIFRVNALSFFQVNTSILPSLIRVIDEEIDEGKEIVDLYSGVGLLGLSFAKKSKKCTLVEVDPVSSNDAENNIKINDFYNCEVIKDSAERAIDYVEGDIFILDPPRKGLDKNVIKRLIEKRPYRILYLSCNPVTLARDVKPLIDNKYYIKRIIPFDFFPIM
jgi:23S rRNA (uracil1939-C5)-methyltransferase